MLKLFSLEGLEAVRDKHTAACTAWVSGPNRPTLHASWCSIKLSTLQTILRGHKESLRTFGKDHQILPCKNNKKNWRDRKKVVHIKVLEKEVKRWGRGFSSTKKRTTNWCHFEVACSQLGYNTRFLKKHSTMWKRLNERRCKRNGGRFPWKYISVSFGNRVFPAVNKELGWRLV